MTRNVANRYHSAAAVHDEFNAALSRMEALMRAQAARLQPHNNSFSTQPEISPSRGAYEPSTSPTPVRPICGAVDTNGDPLMPRSTFLRSVVTPSASLSVQHMDKNPLDEDPVACIINKHIRHHTSSPSVQPTMLKKLQEDLEECTFQPNAVRRLKQLQSSDVVGNTHPPSASPPQPQHHQQAAPSVHDRLYHTTTHKQSKHTVERSKGQHTMDPRKEPLHNGAVGRVTVNPAADASSKPHNRTSSAPGSRDIFSRLYAEGLAKQNDRDNRMDNPSKERQDKRHAASEAKAMAFVAKLAHMERLREEKLRQMRETALENERLYLESKRKALVEHVRRHPGAYHNTLVGPPAALIARGVGHRSAAVQPKPPSGPAVAAASNAAVQHSSTNSGVDGNMVLTPGGTWTRLPPPVVDAASRCNRGPVETNNDIVPVCPSRPPNIAPLPLSRLHH